jgi:addiction module HigA family antidote
MPCWEIAKANTQSPSTTNGGFVSSGGTGTRTVWRSRIITLREMTTMTKMQNIHPGEILLEEFLKPMGLTAYRLSKETGVPQTRIGEIIRGKRNISVATALRLARFFGNSPEFWINLQNHFEIEEKRKLIDKELKNIKPFSASAEHVA